MDSEKLKKIPKMFINGVPCPWDGEKFIIPLISKNNICKFTILHSKIDVIPCYTKDECHENE